jgi:hypothetical protein
MTWVSSFLDLVRFCCSLSPFCVSRDHFENALDGTAPFPTDFHATFKPSMSSPVPNGNDVKISTSRNPHGLLHWK